VANVLSPLFAYEGLTAFFLESAFLGVLLFGRKLVPPWAHFVAAVMVASGTLFSSFWILSANSWMQTPTGYEVVSGQFLPKDWLEVIFKNSGSCGSKREQCRLPACKYPVSRVIS